MIRRDEDVDTPTVSTNGPSRERGYEMTSSPASSRKARAPSLQAVAARLRTIRAHPVLNPSLLLEIWREKDRFPVERDHEPHLMAALGWLEVAQDATPDGGFARGYSLNYNAYFRQRGWQPSYPETTGYIIPTLQMLARYYDRPELDERARRAADWEIEIQLPSGAVQGGVVGQPVSPSVFNTGQVLFGWLGAYETTGEERFAAAARRAAAFLSGVLEPDGHWRTGNSKFARPDATLYNARTAWGLAEAGVRLGEPAFVDAAARNLTAVAALQQPNGWYPHCCLTDATRPLLHTIAYTTRGLLEGGRVLEDESLIGHAVLAAERLANAVAPNGWMAGRFGPDWSGAVAWSCLTGQAQMANIWLRLFAITGEARWLEPVGPVLAFLESTQNRESGTPGIRGGIRGSYPIDGDYGRHEILNWATKFFADALFRAIRARRGLDELRAADQPLA